MEFVDEEDDLAIFFNIVDDIVHPLLKVPTKTSSSNNTHQIQFQHPHTCQAGWYLTVSYSLGQPQGQGCFSDPGIPYKDRVVLAFSGQDLNHTGNFFLPTNNWLQKPCLSLSSQISGIVLQTTALRLGHASHHTGHGLAFAAISLD